MSREIVSFKEGTMVLDIGYGSGSWLMEMNKEFPDAKYVGVDISGTIPDYRASNVT
ncbi:hypothetical protein BDF14DRAFT_1877338 [Spinellus fusiger]|nr:hypothetical protein BDF14DRAFT_1877338 [Spinellus fusiger]